MATSQPPTMAQPSEKTAVADTALPKDHSVSSGPSSPGRNVTFQPPSRMQTHNSLDIDDYFSGPRDMRKHSKLPYFMRIHGSVLPKMILPLSFVGAWAAGISCICYFVVKLTVDTVLLTVLGFVVAFGLSFRCSTAYERYNDGRKYWATLTLTSRNLARIIWVHVGERHAESEELGKQDLLAKLTAINLINAFGVALKHRLRFEPAADYPDLASLIAHLQNTMAVNADQTQLHGPKPTPWKVTGEYLGVTFAQSNPRKLIKRSKDNLGNLPLEILTYLSAYIDNVIETGMLKTSCHQNHAMTDIRMMSDVLSGTERILNTPLPLAWSISISQITWAYIIMLPFQLYSKLYWVTIPGTMFASYLILGLAAIAVELENPFGNDVNDLNLEAFIAEIAADIDVLTSAPCPKPDQYIKNDANKLLYPLSNTGYQAWQQRSIQDIRDALRTKATTSSKSVQINRVKTMVETTEETV